MLLVLLYALSDTSSNPRPKRSAPIKSRGWLACHHRQRLVRCHAPNFLSHFSQHSFRAPRSLPQTPQLSHFFNPQTQTFACSFSHTHTHPELCNNVSALITVFSVKELEMGSGALSSLTPSFFSPVFPSFPSLLSAKQQQWRNSWSRNQEDAEEKNPSTREDNRPNQNCCFFWERKKEEGVEGWHHHCQKKGVAGTEASPPLPPPSLLHCFHLSFLEEGSIQAVTKQSFSLPLSSWSTLLLLSSSFCVSSLLSLSLSLYPIRSVEFLKFLLANA